MTAPIIDDLAPATKPSQAGVYFTPNILHLLRHGTVTPRQAILFAHVDRACSGWARRHADLTDGEEELQQWADYSTDNLRDILQATTRTVNLTINGLREHRYGLLRAQKLDRRWWRLSLGRRGYCDRDGDRLYIAPRVINEFQNGHIVPMEMMVLGRIVGFTRLGQLYYEGNTGLGRFFGLSSEGAQKIIRQLRRKCLVEEEYPTHDELRHRLATDGQSDYRKAGNRRTRVLTPWAELVGNQTEQDDTDEWDDDGWG